MERDALILVGRNLDLVEAAARISEDDTAQVGAWITTGRLTKPNLEQIRVWEADPTRAFRMLIVQPYVLVQEQPAPSDQKE